MVHKELTINGNAFVISNTGIVYKDGIELRQNENFDGYLVVYVGNNRSISVHRLVAMAFLQNDDPNTKKEVNHKDFNRKNNCVENLEWISHVDNIKYSIKHGRYTKKFGKDNPNYGNRKLSEFYTKNPHVALEKQSRKGSQNGKATPIDLYRDGALVRKFDYIGDCCRYLHENFKFSSDAEVVRCGIRRSIKRGVPYKGFTFKK